MSKRRVVLTGAAGMMATVIRAGLQERYDLTMLDVRTTDSNGDEVEGIEIVDLLDKNRDSYRQYFQGADAVVHCGRVQAENHSDPDQFFQAEMNSIQLAYNVYQVSLEENVRRVVTASTNHSADFYESLILDGEWDFVSPETRPLARTYYGWCREAFEHLGFTFAVGEVNGRPLENVHIRIGGPRETDVGNCPRGDLRCMRRALAVYSSQRDMVQLYVKSIEAEDIRNEHGIPFQIFYGISANSHAFWSIANARKVIGYEPQDNSEIRFRDQISEHIRAAEAQSSR